MRHVSEALPALCLKACQKTSQSREFVRFPDSGGAGGLRPPSRRRRSLQQGARRASGGHLPPRRCAARRVRSVRAMLWLPLFARCADAGILHVRCESGRELAGQPGAPPRPHRSSNEKPRGGCSIRPTTRCLPIGVVAITNAATESRFVFVASQNHKQGSDLRTVLFHSIVRPG